MNGKRYGRTTEWNRTATTVRRLAREHLPSPAIHSATEGRARVDAERLLDQMPADLGGASFGAWCDGTGIDADRRYRRELQMAAVMLRMAAALRAK